MSSNKTPLLTYAQFLEADALSKALLIKYAQEASNGDVVLERDKDISRLFEKLARKLGYRVERLAAKQTEAE